MNPAGLVRRSASLGAREIEPAIFVADDGSSFSEVALRQAADHARFCKAELHVLGIVLTTGYVSIAEG